jgi:diguanylate cyclase (GGDEF)-like protein
MDMWFDIFAVPLECDEGDLCYCAYSTRPCKPDEIDLSTVNHSGTLEDVLKTCIRLHDTNDFEQTMKEVISDIRELCDAAVCTIMLMDTSSGTCAVLATNIRKGCTIKRVTQFVNFYDIALSWLDTIGESDCLVIRDENDMEYISKVNNPWYLTLVEAGVDSVVMFPLRYNNEVLGFIWATNFATENALRIKETLELTTYFLSSEVASYKLMKQLEHISYTDLLTGVKNRNAMNSRVSAMTADSEPFSEPYCVIFADLNGLKLTNDRHGHSAGDLLLKKAAIALQEVFEGDEIYRAGGDEFLIIMVGCDKDECERKIALLKDRSQDHDGVSFAVGYSYGDNGCDVRDAMHTADVDMYRDKEEFYKKHPERKLR